MLYSIYSSGEESFIRTGTGALVTRNGDFLQISFSKNNVLQTFSILVLDLNELTKLEDHGDSTNIYCEFWEALDQKTAQKEFETTLNHIKSRNKKEDENGN